jgi:hypothetical protein
MMYSKAKIMKFHKIRMMMKMISKIMVKNQKIMMIKKKEEIMNLNKIMKEERKINKKMIRLIRIKIMISVMETIFKTIN